MVDVTTKKRKQTIEDEVATMYRDFNALATFLHAWVTWGNGENFYTEFRRLSAHLLCSMGVMSEGDKDEIVKVWLEEDEE